MVAGGGGFVVGAAGWLNVLSQEWLPDYFCSSWTQFYVSILVCFCPVVGCGVPWVVPLIGLLNVPWYPCCLCSAVGGVMVSFSCARVVGFMWLF